MYNYMSRYIPIDLLLRYPPFFGWEFWNAQIAISVNLGCLMILKRRVDRGPIDTLR